MKSRIKPRNPLVVPAKFRKAGSHDKPFKAQRRHDRVALFRVCSMHGKQTDGSGLIPTFLWLREVRLRFDPDKQMKKGDPHAGRHRSAIPRCNPEIPGR